MKNSVMWVNVEDEDQGQRIDNYLMKHFKGVPRSRVYRSIRSGEVRVSSRRIKAAYKLARGDCIRVPPWYHQSELRGDQGVKLSAGKKKSYMERVIYEDSRLLVINKPVGEAVHSGSQVVCGLIEQLQSIYGKNLYLVHRLDKDVSGCLMLAKGRAVKAEIQNIWSTEKVEKKYWAVVFLQSESLQKNLFKNQSMVLDSSLSTENGCLQAAVTRIHVLKINDSYAWLEVALETGRKHQIRRHLANADMPIVGDNKYGCFVKNKVLKKTFGLNPGLMLHARSLSITRTDVLSLQAEPDRNFEKILNELGWSY